MSMLSLLAYGAIQSLGDPLDDPKLKGAMVCAIVTDLDGKVLFERNAEQRVMPASNEKLFTCAFALAQRGPDYQSATKFWVNKSQIKVVADGDPTLASSKLLDIHNNYHIGPGHRVFIKEAYKCDRPDTWQIGDAPNRYAPAIHAFSVDRAGFELHAGPKGLSYYPHTPVIETVKVVPNSQSIRIDYQPLASKLLVTGKMPDKDEKIDTLSDPDPTQTALSCLMGVKNPILQDLDDEPKDEPTEKIMSPPISELLGSCLKPSDNCLAEHLLFIGSKADSYSNARKAITEWLTTTVGLDGDSFRCEDGSGLSRKNQTTVHNIAKLLQWTTQQKTSDLWQGSLARAGVGTLAKRLQNVDFVGKTGSLDMVAALSGFVKCKNGDTKIVSVILNHFGCTESDARAIIDRFIENVSQ